MENQESLTRGRRTSSAISGWITTTFAQRAARLGIRIHALQSQLQEHVLLEGTRTNQDTMGILLRIRSDASPSQLHELTCGSPTVRVGNRHITVHLHIETF